ncbi:hypothetical protein AAMO2058_000106000 [Amorphochlora amoebiformis]
MAVGRQLMPRLAILAMVSLLCSMVYLGYRFASVVNSTSEEAIRRMKANQLLESEGSGKFSAFRAQLQMFEDKLDDISKKVSDFSSWLPKEVDNHRTETRLEAEIRDTSKEILSLQRQVRNISTKTDESLQISKKLIDEALRAQFQAYRDRYAEAVNSLQRIEAQVSTFVEENFARQGSLHRWLVGSNSGDTGMGGEAYGTPGPVSMTNIPFDSQMTISWRTECGCTGIALEAMNLVYPLWKAGVKIWLNKCDKGCDYKLTPDLQSMLEDMDKTRPASEDNSFGYQRHRKKKHIYDIVVLHIAYAGICSTKDLNDDARYVISRSMYEADTIESSEVERCNSDRINEVWVPSDFNVDTFASAGVDRRKLFQVGEGIDMYDTWNPAKIPETQEHSAKVLKALGLEPTAKKGWNLMSLYKFERRKNWKGLLLAFLSEFSKKDDICFFLKTHEGWEGNPEEWIKSYLKSLAKKGAIDSADLPCIYLIDTMIDSEILPAVFKEMNGFVLPSHAEGWGLPAMEAMAMELPVVITDWGGVTQFSSGYTNRSSAKDPYGRFIGGYAIRIDRMEKAFAGKGSGNWAVPSVTHLRSIMRHMYENQAAAKESGKLGRQKVLRFDRSAVAAKILRNFNEIYSDIVVPNTKNHVTRTSS